METKTKISIGATGDILLHKRLYNRAKNKITQKYNFDKNFKNVEHLFDEADINIVNLESIIAGKKIGLSSFPRFNSPVEIGEKIKELGVDIVNIANNHVLDKGEEGLLASIENIEKIGLQYVGAYKSEEDSETLRIINKNNLRICFLSYTSSTNGNLLKESKKYMVSKYLPKKLKRIKNLLKKIKRENIADITIVSLHFGKEYHMLPTSEQREVATDLANAGADLIIGHHPHVLQPPEIIQNSRGNKSYVIYSLGNFFTGQKGLYRQIGGFFNIDIEYNSKTPILVNFKNPKLTLTFVDSTDVKDFKIHIFKDYIKENPKINTDIGEFDSMEVYNEIYNRLHTYTDQLEIN